MANAETQSNVNKTAKLQPIKDYRYIRNDTLKNIQNCTIFSKELNTHICVLIRNNFLLYFHIVIFYNNLYKAFQYNIKLKFAKIYAMAE